LEKELHADPLLAAHRSVTAAIKVIEGLIRHQAHAPPTANQTEETGTRASAGPWREPPATPTPLQPHNRPKPPSPPPPKQNRASGFSCPSHARHIAARRRGDDDDGWNGILGRHWLGNHPCRANSAGSHRTGPPRGRCGAARRTCASSCVRRAQRFWNRGPGRALRRRATTSPAQHRSPRLRRLSRSGGGSERRDRHRSGPGRRGRRY
jgi:hypothetical protein